eukprot:m.99902 g.99902  ORF g.99902 m.99902 type:complete len:110 (-) comp8913_c0_seq5:118-447(-)
MLTLLSLSVCVSKCSSSMLIVFALWRCGAQVGEYVCGISLLSSAIMQFRNHDAGVASALVQRRSLYVMRRRVRYDYTHQVLLGPSLRWPMDGPEGVDFQRQRRITVLFR